MAESLKQIFEGHTDRINHATELLKVLGDREGQFVWKKYKVGAPEKYTEVEYIESTGTQRINTGVKVTANTRLKLDATMTTVQNQYSGYYNNPHLLFGFESNGRASLYWGNSQQFCPSTVYGIGDKVVFEVDGTTHTGKINNESYVFPDATFATRIEDFPLFMSVDNGTFMYKCKQRSKVFEAWEKGVQIRNMVSCVAEDGSIGMYDLIENEFHGNVGSGTFIAGNPTGTVINGKPTRGDFVGFVVSDAENSYPDVGIQDGYWYELSKATITKVGDTVSLYSGSSSGTQSYAHGLGRKPDSFGVTSAKAGSSNSIYDITVAADDTYVHIAFKYYTSSRSSTVTWFATIAN